MKKIFLSVLFVTLIISSCDVLDQMAEVKRFAQCQFSIESVNVDKLGGIEIKDYTKASDLNLPELMMLGQKLISGKLTADMIVTIKARNYESKKAAISGVEWQLYMKDEQYSNGRIDEYVEVLPGQSTSFDVDVTFDILKILKSEKINTILDIVLDGNGQENLKELDIAVKVKPFYTSNGNVHEYPGFITIRP